MKCDSDGRVVPEVRQPAINPNRSRGRWWVCVGGGSEVLSSSARDGNSTN